MDLYRQDFGSIGQAQRTPQGGYRAPAVIASAGVLTYEIGGRKVREYTPPAVLEAALATLRDAPITVEHPVGGDRLVSPERFAELAQGHAAEPKFDGRDARAELVVQGARGVAYLAQGVRGVSAGYTAKIDPTPGVTPEGEPYDVRRTAITFNHVALVRTARQPRARVMLDSAPDRSDDSPRVRAARETAQKEAAEAYKQPLRLTRDVAATARAKDWEQQLGLSRGRP